MSRRSSDILNLPNRGSFGVLGCDGQVAIGAALLKALGFEPTSTTSLVGRSGLEHRISLAGVDTATKRVIVFQTGKEELPRVYSAFSATSRRPTRGSDQEKSPEEKAREWIQRALFTTYDIKSALEQEGGTCEVVFFFNTFLAPIASMTEHEMQDWHRSALLPRDTKIVRLGSHNPVVEVDVPWMRERITSVGAAFLDAQDLSIEELSTLAGNRGQSNVSSTAAEVLRRTRLEQFFSPPLDELLLGTLGKAGGLEEVELVRAEAIARANRHSVSPNTIATTANHTDPIATLTQLKSMKHVSFKRRECFLEPSGKAVVQEWEKTSEESLFIKILRELRLPDLVATILKGLGA